MLTSVSVLFTAHYEWICHHWWGTRRAPTVNELVVVGMTKVLLICLGVVVALLGILVASQEKMLY
ncbi:hypothetical protein FOZ62_007866, partial [Perkinsus olseni]